MNRAEEDNKINIFRVYSPNVLRPLGCTHMQLDSLHNKEECMENKNLISTN